MVELIATRLERLHCSRGDVDTAGADDYRWLVDADHVIAAYASRGVIHRSYARRSERPRTESKPRRGMRETTGVVACGAPAGGGAESDD